MFLRRVFSRKTNNNDSVDSSDDNRNGVVSQSTPKKYHRHASLDDKRGLAVLQLTPLWEHIIRTRKLPENLDHNEMFAEFMERLRDPEWQVRQHALRVLVDVLMVIGQKADNYFEPIVPQLVENLGHPAPTVRKGALDALRIYISETAMPEAVLSEIMDIGLNQRITTEPFGGRLTCGVMLSLPALIQSVLHTPKRSYILRSTIEKLIQKIAQVSHQEITLKVLLRIRDMIGAREFSEYMKSNDYREFQLLCDIYGLEENKSFVDTGQGTSAWQSADTDYGSPNVGDNVFGSSVWKNSSASFDSNDSSTAIGIVNDKKFGPRRGGNTFDSDERPPSRVKQLPTWKPSDDNSFETDDFYPTLDDLQFNSSPWKSSLGVNELKSKSAIWKSPTRETMYKQKSVENNDSSCHQKVIMETEIQINDDTLTMRILESKDDPDDEKTFFDGSGSGSEDDGNKGEKVTTPIENSGVIHVLSDSELEEINNLENTDSLRRTPKRVTFGGEIIKMRTPDSDLTNPGEIDDNVNSIRNFENLNFLTIDIPNDNTKPVPSSPAKRVVESKPTVSPKPSPSMTKPRPQSSESRQKSASPSRRFRRISISPVDDIISPKPAHKEITIMHNLQRSPCISPTRHKRQMSGNINLDGQNDNTNSVNDTNNNNNNSNSNTTEETTPIGQVQHSTIQSWEDLNLVDRNTIKDLKSGDWRYRSRAISTIEETLKSSENLARVQPYLDSLLRSLLSSEKHAEVAEDKRRVVMNLISRLPLDNLENRTTQIITGLCRQGGAGSNRVLKALMQRLPPAVIVSKLLSEEFLQTKSSKFRENALQMVMYALMTFPSTYFDTKTCVTRAVYAALDRKKRVRQAALDVLAILGQVTSPRVVMDIVQNIGGHRDDGKDLYAAVKARLARKQLPNITADGCVQYALRIPSPYSNGDQLEQMAADIAWISAGIGSVSPTSLNKRLKFQHPMMTNTYNGKYYESLNRIITPDGAGGRTTKPHEILGMGVGVKPVDLRRMDNGKLSSYANTTTALQMPSISVLHNGMSNVNKLNEYSNLLPGRSIKSEYKTYGDANMTYRARIVNPNFSDSSQDGRTSDGTSVDSSEMSGRIHLTSRFPAVERTEATRMYVDSNGSLNATYPKATYSIHKKRIYNRGTCSQDSFNESSFDESPRPVSHPPPYQISGEPRPPTRKFMYSEKYTASSKQEQHIRAFDDNDSKLEQENQAFSEDFVSRKTHAEEKLTPKKVLLNNNHADNPDLERAKSGGKPQEPQENCVDNGDISTDDKESPSGQSTPKQELTEVEVVPPNTVLDLTPSEEAPLFSRAQATINNLNKETKPLSRPQSAASVSNHESVVARPKSVISRKSVMDEEVIEKDEIDKALESFQNKAEPTEEPITQEEMKEEPESKESEEVTEEVVETEPQKEAQNQEVEEQPPPKEEEKETKEPQIEETKIPQELEEISMIEDFVEKHLRTEPPVTKSCDSIFDTSMKADSEIKSIASTDTGSDYQISVHAQSLDDPNIDPKNFPQMPLKPQYAPLTRKAKTTLFGRNRRVSPVKQSMKPKAETFPQTLERFDKPKDALHQCVNQLDSSNWETIMIGLRSMVRLIRHHPGLVENQIHAVCMQLAKSVKNLRSQVARAACQASGELFSLQSKNLEQECDDLTASLLHRTADTNRFLRADATRALEIMCDNLSPPKVLHILTTRAAVHQNAVVRTTCAKLLNRLSERLGCDKVFALSRENRDKFILTGANLLLEGSLDTRSYAKALFRRLSDYPHYHRILFEVIPPRTYRHIEKTLKSIS